MGSGLGASVGWLRLPRAASIARLCVSLILAMAIAWIWPAVAAGPTYLGVASCAGSTCHGRPTGNGAVVRQDELARWQDPSSQGGAHARAYAVLAGARGQRIAATLGLGPATSAGACLGCHATAVPPAQRGARFVLSDGVGCESCHGPAGGWIASHYTVQGNHADNVAHGMIPLDRPATRAGVCLDCHFGSARGDQFVSHRMMAAGHPRVSFELDLFSALQQHWNEDADYAARKGRSDGVRLWAIGQAEAVRRQLSLFLKPALASEGLFPEFYFFDCHSCHRAIDDDPGRQRRFVVNPARPIPFGTPPFNDENMVMLSAVAGVLAPGEAAAFDAAARDFHASAGKGRAAVTEATARLLASTGALEDRLGRAPTSGDTAFTVIAAIAARAGAERFTDYEGSVQAVMAVDTLLNATVKSGRVTVGAAAGIRASINQAYAAVKTPATYDPSAFRVALGKAARSIGSLR